MLTFVLSGLSKIAGLPQMKAAWIAALGPERERAEALARLEIVADTFLSMNAPVQLAMPSWLAGRAAIQAQILERARGRRRCGGLRGSRRSGCRCWRWMRDGARCWGCRVASGKSIARSGWRASGEYWFIPVRSMDG